MTAAQTTDSNLTFSQLASDERIARTVAALGPRGVTAEVVQNGAAERARILELLPLGAEGLRPTNSLLVQDSAACAPRVFHSCHKDADSRKAIRIV